MKFQTTLLLAAIASSFAMAKTFSFPHVLETSGRIVGVASGASGGWPTAVNGATEFSPLQLSVCPTSRDPFLETACRVMNSGQSSPFDLTVHRIDPKNGRPRVAQTKITWNDCFPTGISLPACIAIDEPGVQVTEGFMGVECRVTGFDPLGNVGPTDAEKAMASKAKAWMVNNFRLTCPGVNTTKCKSDVYVWKIKLVDIDGDGKPEQVPDPGSFTFHVPYDGRLSVLKGADLPVQLDYLDENGLPALTLKVVIKVNSVSPSDMFDIGDLNGDGVTTRVSGAVHHWSLEVRTGR